MRVLICGDRGWTNAQLIHDKLNELAQGHLDKIDCVIDGMAHGADHLGYVVAAQLGIATRRFPANWNKYGRAAGPIRNQQMLDEGQPDLVLAFHNDLTNSKGTKDMVNRARKAGVQVEVITEADQ